MTVHSYGRMVDGEMVDLRTPARPENTIAADDAREEAIRAYAEQILKAGSELEEAARDFGKSLYEVSEDSHRECSAKYAAAVARFAVTTNSAIGVLGQALHEAGAEVVFHG